MSNLGIVEYFGINDSSSPCGYCKGLKEENSDYGMWAHQLSPDNYQNLIDRNWRRSGKYCYKPILERTCCPMYTIRCNALEFSLRKSHKKVIKRFNYFLMSGQKTAKRGPNELREMQVNSDVGQVTPASDLNLDVDRRQFKTVATPELNRVSPLKCDNVVMTEDIKAEPKIKQKILKITKAKTIRKERKLNKIMLKEKCDRDTAFSIMSQEYRNKVMKRSQTKTLEQFITEVDNKANNAHKLEIRFVSTTCDEYKETFEASHEVYRKYQMAIHGDTFDKCTPKQYKRFLIDSPLQAEDFTNTRTNTLELPDHFGSYHQQYWLDDKLIAVGVIDILPHCVSSVYLYYDPDFDFLSLGTYSALRELYLVRKLQKTLPNLKYYYMGFYIHSCPKMRYKGRYSPSDLLCGETFSWHPIDKCVAKLDVRKYSRFEDNPKAIDSDGTNITDSEIMILFSRSVVSLRQYKCIREVGRKEEEDIKEYAKLIGRKCATNMLLYRS